MKTNQSKTMKTMKTNKLLKLIPVLGIIALCTTQVQAQTTDPASILVQQAQTAIKVVDNKGTIKYFQSKNGITQITSTSPGSATTTTWQLGGTLTDNTYIDVDNKAFILNGLTLETGTASTDANSGTDAGAGTGYALLVRDELTGATRKMLVSSLIASGQGEQVITSSTQTLTGDFTSTAFTGLSTNLNSVSVYRNGIKLRQTTDWVFETGSKIKIPTTADLKIYSGDVIEVQWVK